MNEPVVSRNRLLKFILPSLLGVFLFLFPVKTADGYTIVLAILSSQFTELFMPAMPFFVYSVIFVSALGALVTKIFKPDFILKRPALNIIFNVSALWVAVRLARCC